MRRCLHSLLVGVLTFSLTVDVARACGHLRRLRCCPPPCAAPAPIACPPIAWDDCGRFEVAAGCAPGCGPVVVAAGGCEEIACGTPLDCCGAEVVTSAPLAVGAGPAPATESVIVPPVATPSPATPSTVDIVPKLEPIDAVSPASATTPPAATDGEVAMPEAEESEAGTGAESAPETPVEEPGMAEEPEVETVPEETVPEEPETEEPAMEEQEPPAEEPEAPVEPQPEPAAPEERPNIFADEEGKAPADDVPPTEPAPADDQPADGAEAGMLPDLPEIDADAGADMPALGEPGVEEPGVDPLPADDLPADELPVEPPAEPAADADAAAEPMRRWIDATASFAAVGRLVAVRGDEVEILRADGRSVTVPLGRLSGFDRDYVAAAGQRLLAARGTGPRPGDTAGL